MMRKMTSHSDIEFFFRIEPDVSKLTHQNGIEPGVLGNGKPYMHKTPALENLEAFYVSHLKRNAPKEPWTCPIHLTTAWYFLKPKRAKGIFKTTKPDTDNLVKTLKDCMKQAGFFADDALVVIDTIAKYWRDESGKHGIHIRLRDLSNENEKENT